MRWPAAGSGSVRRGAWRHATQDKWPSSMTEPGLQAHSRDFAFERGTVSRFILICSSDFAAERYQALLAEGEAKVVAVDAGYSRMRAGGPKPYAIIGDFDSLGHLPYAPGARIMRFPEEKDESDLELALSYVEEQGADEVFVFGALGGRLDQTVATLQVARGFADAFQRLAFVSPREVVHVLGPNRQLTVHGTAAKYISVLSAVDESRGVRIEGLKYDFEGTLTNDCSRGLSNEFMGTPAHVSVDDGTLFVIEQY